MPHYQDIEWAGLEFSPDDFRRLMEVNRDLWRREVVTHEELFIHHRLPPEMIYECELLICRF